MASGSVKEDIISTCIPPKVIMAPLSSRTTPAQSCAVAAPKWNHPEDFRFFISPPSCLTSSVIILTTPRERWHAGVKSYACTTVWIVLV